MGLRGITRGYKSLQGVTGCYKGLQGRTRRFSISIFQERAPIQYHYDQVFARHQRSENSLVTTQKSKLMFGSPSLLFYLDVRTGVFFKYYFVTFSLLLLLMN